jgi:uncharacterized protein (TIGR02145 family)
MFIHRIHLRAFTILFILIAVSCKKENPVRTDPEPQPLVIEEDAPVTDYDGNVYRTIKIGSQIWMAENLKSTHYSDGTRLPFFEYNNDTANVRVYGRLYRWASAMKNAASSNSNPSGVQGAAPVGWHIPSDAEWQVLIDNLGGNAVAGGKLKEADTLHWLSPNTGATNESKFNALPSGWYDFTEEFRRIGEWTFLTTSTSPASDYVYTRVLKYDITSANRGDLHPYDAIPIRCVKD